ncbi:hypothetical protein AK812_SmicGene21669 [Symbiodinium microadriaticum]|uniref:Uncharacterized protein n=1 Tax=Symbiodinium microadriaticum TaxID=2951 RepID=A0A1Q9DLV3_SYMMI|nr:hypothetical protein AK812_SmicGene21669 [Symbiodinium microadriaticum]
MLLGVVGAGSAALKRPDWRGGLPVSLDQRAAEVSPEAVLGLAVPGAVRGLPQISPVFHKASVADGDVLAKLWGQPPTRQGDGEPEVWFREGWTGRAGNL